MGEFRTADDADFTDWEDTVIHEICGWGGAEPLITQISLIMLVWQSA